MRVVDVISVYVGEGVMCMCGCDDGGRGVGWGDGCGM